MSIITKQKGLYYQQIQEYPQPVYLVYNNSVAMLTKDKPWEKNQSSLNNIMN